MRRFLYFFAGVPGMNPGMMRQRGVLDRFTLRPGGGKLIEHSVTAVDRGPAGAGGCIVAAGPQIPAAAVRWLEGPKFWVGLEEDGGVPGPEDLAREIGIGGYELQLADSNAWKIPLVRKWNDQTLSHESNLPNVMTPVLVGGRYQYSKKVRPEFEAIDALAEWVFHSFVAQATLPLDQVIEKAVELLAVNYRLGAEEIGLLGLLDETSALQILRLAADIGRIEAQAQEMTMSGIEFAEPKIEEE